MRQLLHQQLITAQRELFALVEVQGRPDDDVLVRHARTRVMELEERLKQRHVVRFRGLGEEAWGRVRAPDPSE